MTLTQLPPDPRDIARIVNRYVGSDTVRWNQEASCFTTATGSEYQPDTIEDVARGILKSQAANEDELPWR